MLKILKDLKKEKINHNEKNLSKIVRKIIVAKKKINKNQTFSFENITSKRGNNGMSAKYFFDLINKKSNKNYLKNDKIKKKIFSFIFARKGSKGLKNKNLKILKIDLFYIIHGTYIINQNI